MKWWKLALAMAALGAAGMLIGRSDAVRQRRGGRRS